MKKWAVEHPVLLSVFAALVGGAIVVIVGLLFGQRLDTSVTETVFWMLFFRGGTYFAQKRFRKVKSRLDEQGQSLMFLRCPESRPGSLSGVWLMGVATPAQGRIDFQPAVYDELIPSGRSRALTRLRASDLAPRLAGRHDQQQSVPFGFRIITMDSDGGRIEIADSPDTIQKIQDAVGQASP